MSIVSTIFRNEVTNELIGLEKSWQFFLCLGFALTLGIIIALCYMYKNDFSKSLVFTIALLPSIVCVLIMLVSGSMGAAIAVGGVFGLTRFRSATGTSREIVQIFLAMAAGLITGLGYIWIAVALVLLVEAVSIIFTITRFGDSPALRRTLKITIPEELDYSDLTATEFSRCIRCWNSSLPSWYQRPLTCSQITI